MAKKRTEFALVRWVDEESVGVMPTSAVRSGQKVYVGSFADMKYNGKYYEVEILKISGKSS